MKIKILRTLAVIMLLAVLILIPAVPASAATIVITPTSGAAGTQVTIIGSGFIPNGNYELRLGDISIDPISAGSLGDINSSFRIPTGTAVGTYDVKLYTCATPPILPCPTVVTTNTMSFTVTAGTTTTTTTINPAITITPTEGPFGTNITVNGTGFTASSTINILVNSVNSMVYPTTNTSGAFTSAPVSVSLQQPGTYEVRASDSVGNAATTYFTVTQTINSNMSKNSGNIGTKVNISGVGFKASTQITVKYDDKVLADATVNTDTTGSFRTSFTVPPSTGGTHTVTLSDGVAAHEQKYNFTVETTPPTTPGLAAPPNNTIIKDTALLEWGAVTDDSTPVTYTLQISADPSFNQSTLALEKKGLTESRYSLAAIELEKLTPAAGMADKKYYWSVQAVDAASNKSGWASAGAFIMPAPKAAVPVTTPTVTPTVTPTPTAKPAGGISAFGNLPGWSIYVLAVLFALLIGIIGFWLGRKTSYY